MPALARSPVLAVTLALALLAAGCGGGDDDGAPATSAPATVTTALSGDSDARLAFAEAANDLADYCLAKAAGKPAAVDPAGAVDRMLAAYRALGEEPQLREALQGLGIGTCYPDGAARIRDAVGAPGSP